MPQIVSHTCLPLQYQNTGEFGLCLIVIETKLNCVVDRCLVPYCENTFNATYDSDWVPYAVPPNKIVRSSTTFEPEQCFYFKQKVENGELNETCEPDGFTNEIERCNEWVFDPHERSIVNDVSLGYLINRLLNIYF